MGYAQIKKTAGTGTPAIATQFNIPVTSVNPRTPLNNVYPMMENKNQYPANSIRGRNTPSCGFSTYLKTSWVTAALMNSLISQFDTNNDGDAYAIHLNDGTTAGTYSDVYFEGAKGSVLTLSGAGAGGGVAMSWAALAASTTQVATYTAFSVDPGALLDASQIDFGASATADLVETWTLRLLRGAAYTMFFNAGSYDPFAVDCGAFGGSVDLIQSPQFTLSPGTSFIIRIGPIGSPVLTATCTLNRDEDIYDRDIGMGRIVRRYTCVNLATGANPVVFS
jgi:hypothetical protein